MIFTPPKTLGLALGSLGLAFLAGLALLLLNLIRVTPPSFASFIFLCLLLASLAGLAWLGYHWYGLARARYVLSRNALVVEWGGRREIIPLDQIEEIRPAADFQGTLRPRGLNWPGHVLGQASVPSLGAVEFFATLDKPGLVLAGHPDGWLALSPPDPELFLRTFAERRAEGVADPIPRRSMRPAFEDWALWRDRKALGLILAGGLGALLLVGYLALIFPQLPPQFALHFNAQGQPDRFGPPQGLFVLPVIAGGAWAVNTLIGLWLYRREAERAGAYLLFSATVFVQALVWVAAFGLLNAGRAA